MPQAANIVINDGAGSPVSHTFAPIGFDANRVLWFEQILPVPANGLAAKRIGYKQERGIVDGREKSLTASSKVSYTLHVPTLETLSNNSAGITPPPQLAYREVARVSFELAERSTEQERKDTRVLLWNLISIGMAIANIDKLQPSYA